MRTPEGKALILGELEQYKEFAYGLVCQNPGKRCGYIHIYTYIYTYIYIYMYIYVYTRYGRCHQHLPPLFFWFKAVLREWYFFLLKSSPQIRSWRKELARIRNGCQRNMVTMPFFANQSLVTVFVSFPPYIWLDVSS